MRSFLLGAMLASIVGSLAQAATLFENSWDSTTTFLGYSTGGYILNSGGWQMYDDFSLAQDSTIETLVGIVSGNETATQPYATTATFSILDETRTTELQRITVAATAGSLYQQDYSGGMSDLFLVTYDFAGLNLQAGTYWLASNLSLINGRTSGNDLSSIQERTHPSTTTYVRDSDLMFQLNGSAVAAVPLPAGLPLMFGGIAALGAIGLRRKRSRK